MLKLLWSVVMVRVKEDQLDHGPSGRLGALDELARV